MRLEEVLNNKSITQGGIRLAQAMSPRAGYALADFAAAVIAGMRPAIYRTVEANMRHVLGKDVDPQRLAAVVRAVFANAGRFNYEFFHAIEYEAAQLAQQVEVSERTLQMIRANMAQGKGTLLLGTHTGNFNLGILTLSTCRIPIQGLSLANPNEGFELLNRVRARWDLELTPITPQSLRQAIRRLKQGGVVMTALDRPVPEDNHLVPFFDMPAYFAIGPVRLAVMTGANVILGSCYYEPGRGHVLQAQPVDILVGKDKQEAIKINALRMAQALEQFIRRYPDQWLMFHPFWPEERDLRFDK